MSTFSRPMAMTERQKKFRDSYINDVSPFYNGLLHIGVMYVAGISAIYYCATQLDNPTWAWLTIIPVAIAGNFVEWAMHKYVMHRLIDVFALRAIYDRHTRQHHQYFTDTDYTIDTVKEHRIVFFPWRVLIVLGVAGTILGYIAAKIFNPNVGYILYMTMVGHYLIYETFHYCCHVKENWFVRNMPFINTIRRHHAAHHNLGIMMHKNMNLTFPLADWIMGTSDLKRGLIGTLFNGFSEEHVDPKLKPIIEKFRNGRVQEEKVTLEGPILDQQEEKALQS
ncbi:sterol desaturase family protein [Polynucleobacter acidiphobus]|uniref:sterol desaturase family protein n=1 Tax=Polynucleobacter acidiphobus TaxID=556053 RepID=UPI001F38C139|nr:sterol desaturase family protein [Polynucleobacter acidiphobus]